MTRKLTFGATSVALFGILLNFSVPNLFPHGLPVFIPEEERAVFAPFDPSNVSLMGPSGKVRKIFESTSGGRRLLGGHETIAFDGRGRMYTLTETSKLVEVSIPEAEDFLNDDAIPTARAETRKIVDLGPGRPLGGAFSDDGLLYVADSVLGLTRVRLDNGGGPPVVELLASSVELEDGTTSPILFADDVAIGPKTGHVYFTDASDIPSQRANGKWETLYTSIQDALRGKRAGRLLRYDPSDGAVKVLASGIHFANGVSVDREERFVVVVETFMARVLRYDLTKGALEIMTDRLPGVPDGVDCSHARTVGGMSMSPRSEGKCYVAIPSAKPDAIKLLHRLPPVMDWVLRGLLMSLPSSLAPDPKKTGCILEIDAVSGNILNIWQDPEGIDIADVHGVTVHEDNIYIGSLHNEYIGVYSLW